MAIPHRGYCEDRILLRENAVGQEVLAKVEEWICPQCWLFSLSPGHSLLHPRLTCLAEMLLKWRMQVFLPVEPEMWATDKLSQLSHCWLGGSEPAEAQVLICEERAAFSCSVHTENKTRGGCSALAHQPVYLGSSPRCSSSFLKLSTSVDSRKP